MRILLAFVLCVFLIIACSTKSEVVKDTDYLKYGTRASVIEKVWGRPDETMAFQDYRAKGYYSIGGIGGSWGTKGGSVSGFGFGETYTPTTIVWTYKDKGIALFFEKRGLLFDEIRTAIMVWRLVGWEKLESKLSEPATKPVPPPEKPIPVPAVTPSPIQAKIVTVTWTFANIRSGAGDNYSVLATVKQGDKLTVIGESGEWFNVQLEGGQQGWISNRVVK